MNRKTLVKVVLDIMMMLTLVLMYQKKVISLDFHEIGGLILFGGFLIHKILNWKWIVRVSGRLFDRTFPAKTRLSYWLDLLLLVSFILIILSGVLISEVLFNFVAAAGWKTVHYFASALALVFIGMHVGLHWGYLTALWKKRVRLPKIIARPLAALLLAALLGFGGYSIATTSFLLWLGLPFDSSLIVEGGGGGGEEAELTLTAAVPADPAEPTPELIFLAAETATAEATDAAVSDAAAGSGETSGESAIAAPEEETEHTGSGGGKRDGTGAGKNQTTTVEASNIALVIAQFLSITAVFAAITRLTERLILHKKRIKVA